MTASADPSPNAKLSIVADNGYILYLDGEPIAENENSWERSWSQGFADTYDRYFSPGRHVLAVEGTDGGGIAGLLLGLTFRNNALISSSAWKVSTKVKRGWNQPNFNDQNWPYATPYSSSAWPFIFDFSLDVPPRWIWAAPQEGGAMASKVYLRVAFEVDEAGNLLRPPLNLEPVVKVKPQRFNPGQVVNLATEFDKLFSAKDPDGDAIASYEFFVTDPGQNGYFINNGEISGANQFSINASALPQLQWVAGPHGSEDGLRLKATDVHGNTNEWQPDNALWISRQRLSINAPRVREGEPIDFVLTRPDDSKDQSLTVFLQVNDFASVADSIAVLNPSVQTSLNNGIRIPLTFERGETQVTLKAFRALVNSVAETAAGGPRYRKVMDVDVYGQESGGVPIIGTLARASDATPTITLTSLQASVEEGQKAFFVMERKGNTSLRTEVFYSVSGDATAGEDYSQTSGSVVFKKGDHVTVFAIPTLSDSVAEPDETLTLTLSTGRGDYAIDPEKSSGAVLIKPSNLVLHFSDPEPWPYQERRTTQSFRDLFSVARLGDADSIATYEIQDSNQDPLSGYFLLNGRPLAASSPASIPASQIPNLLWVTGYPGEQDSVHLKAMARSGVSSDTQSALLQTAPAPTGYIVQSTSGFRHVTEGDAFEFSIRRQNNLDQPFTLQWGILGEGGSITAGPSDFSGNPFRRNTIRFEPGSPADTEIRLSVQTKSDGAREGGPTGTETAGIWIFDSQYDNGKSRWQENPAYKVFEFDIHELPVYLMSDSLIAVEGDRASIAVTRFGNGTQESSVNLKAQSLQSLYPSRFYQKNGSGQVVGLAEAGKDFEPVDGLITFSADGTQVYETLIKSDGKKEPGPEVFAWSLDSPSPNSFILEDHKVRTVTTQEAPSRTLLGAAPWYSWIEAIANFFGFSRFNPSSETTISAFAKEVSNPDESRIALPRTDGSAVMVPAYNNKNELIGMVGVGKGPVTANTLELVGNDSASAQSREQVSGVSFQTSGSVSASPGSILFEAEDPGTKINERAYPGISKLYDANGRPLVATGGDNIVANGGGNLVTNAGGNLVATGGDNLVATGGDNLIPRNGTRLTSGFKIQARGIHQTHDFFVAEPSGALLSSDNSQLASPAGFRELGLLPDNRNNPLFGTGSDALLA